MKNYIDLIKTYKEIYNLPRLDHLERVSFDFLRLLRDDYNFVVIAIYNEKRELLLSRDLNKNIGWELVGGYIQKDETLECAVNRIVLKEVGLRIDELQPIAALNNIFRWNTRTVIHRGIAFVALSRSQINPQPKNIRIIYTKEAPEIMVYQDRKIFILAKKILEAKPFEPPYKEIESGNKFLLFHYFNKYLVKILGGFASRKIFKKIIDLISNYPKTILDVSCGDDDSIFKIENLYRPHLCVANDISWKVLSILRRRQKKSDVVFTNHDVLTLPFAKRFDLVLFKNTLHHIPFLQQEKLIKKLSNFSRQLIIVDIENPYNSNFLAKIWHWYYVHILGDQGGDFLDLEGIKKIVRTIKNKKIDTGTIKTIKGEYFYVSLVEKEAKEEVEIKARIKPSMVDNIRKNILGFGAVLKDKSKETDVYFTPKDKDFIKTKECLRIREKNGKIELTYKGATTKLMAQKKQFWKKEINIPVNCTKEEVENLLSALGCKKIVDVFKEREKFILNDKIITLDNVEKAGWFIEIEMSVKNKKEREWVLEENFKLLKKLEIDEKNVVEEPYRDIVLQNINQNKKTKR